MNAVFTTRNGVVTVMMRAELGEDGAEAIGDMIEDIHPGQDFAGVSYEDMVAADAGEIAFDDAGAGTIVRTGAIDAMFAAPAPPEFDVDRDDVTPDHDDVVRWYRRDGHAAMNVVLRGGAAGSPETLHNIELMHEVVSYGKVTQSGIVYRAVDAPGMVVEDADAKFGEVITWRGFTSTTTDERFARGHLRQDGVLFRILLPQGARALLVVALANDSDPDHEVILPAGARFVVREAAGLRAGVEIDLVMLKGAADGEDEDNEA